MSQWLINEKLVFFVLFAVGFTGQFWCQWKWFWPYASIRCQQWEQVRHYDIHDIFSLVHQVESTSSSTKVKETWFLIKHCDLHLTFMKYVFMSLPCTLHDTYSLKAFGAIQNHIKINWRVLVKCKFYKNSYSCEINNFQSIWVAEYKVWLLVFPDIISLRYWGGCNLWQLS